MIHYNEEEEDDDSYWNEPDPKDYRTGNPATDGSTGSMKCPQCGSYNTAQGTYFDECRSCGWGQGY